MFFCYITATQCWPQISFYPLLTAKSPGEGLCACCVLAKTFWRAHGYQMFPTESFRWQPPSLTRAVPETPRASLIRNSLNRCFIRANNTWQLGRRCGSTPCPRCVTVSVEWGAAAGCLKTREVRDSPSGSLCRRISAHWWREPFERACWSPWRTSPWQTRPEKEKRYHP